MWNQLGVLAHLQFAGRAEQGLRLVTRGLLRLLVTVVQLRGIAVVKLLHLDLVLLWLGREHGLDLVTHDLTQSAWVRLAGRSRGVVENTRLLLQN